MEDYNTKKVETIPLLSPTTESEIFKEVWALPPAQIKSPKLEDHAEVPVWEENFQDLSDWCMDTFQGQCDFHTGESSSFKLSGTKYEGNDVSTSEEGVSKYTRAVSDAVGSFQMNTNKADELPGGNCHLELLPSQPNVVECKKEMSVASAVTLPDFWLDVTKTPSSVATIRTPWIKKDDTDVSAPLQPGDLDLDDACRPSFDSSESQRETWDVLRTVESTGSDAFDLLSYVCDDELRSPTGSSSMDSSVISQSGLSVHSSIGNMQHGSTETRTNRRKGVVNYEPPMERRSTSTITSAEVSSVTAPRRSDRTRTSASSQVDKISKNSSSNQNSKTEKRGRKRFIESDTDDDDEKSVVYKETREKNNEASRRSRLNKKAKEAEMAQKAVQLEKDNRILKMKVEELEKLVTSMRSALLRSALKKES